MPGPKRTSELMHPRSKNGGGSNWTPKKGESRAADPYPADENWHPIATRIYESLGLSGQADFFQASDWAFAFTICDDISRFKREEEAHDLGVAKWLLWHDLSEDERAENGLHPKWAPKVPKGGSAMKMGALIDALGRLGMTEADRLKARIELSEPEPDEIDAEVVAIESWKSRLGG